MSEAVFFYTFSVLALGAAVSVVANPRPIYSVLSLLVVMFCLAALFVMLGAYFVAALQILLYAGAVLVLFLFVMMLLNLEQELQARLRWIGFRTLVACAAAFLLGAQLCRFLQTPGGEPPFYAVPAPSGSVESIGEALFREYLIPFELTSFLILAAIIGAVTLAKQKPNE